MSAMKFSLATVVCTLFWALSSVSASAADSPEKAADKSAIAWDQDGPPALAAAGPEDRRPRDMRGGPPDDGNGPPQFSDGPHGPGRDGQFPPGPPPEGRDGPGRDGHYPPGPSGPEGGPRHHGPGEGPMPPGMHPGPWPFGDKGALEEHDPEMYKVMQQDRELDHKSRELAAQYRQAPSQQRDAVKKLLEQVVEQHFDVRQQRHALELKRLEEELKRLHERMDRRAKARKEVVEKRVSELLGIDDDLHF